jgi:hypothetical protein
MLVKRIVLYGMISLAALVMGAAILGKPGAQAASGRVVAPAYIGGKVTISTSSDGLFTFITCSTDQQPPLWRRLFRDVPLSGAFVVQRRKPQQIAVTHTGPAHVEFQGDLLRIAFDDSSQFVFTILSIKNLGDVGGIVEHVGGLASYPVAGFSTHASFVASRNWGLRACHL